MFAVIKAGGKQYRVAEDQVLKVEGVKGEPGTIVTLGDVIMLGGDTPTIGSPMISGASVAVEVIEHDRGEKVIAFKKRRRKNSRRRRGHRQEFTLIRISEILTGGAKPTKGAKPKHVPKAKPAAEEGDDAREEKAQGQAGGEEARGEGKGEKVRVKPGRTPEIASSGFTSKCSSIFVR